MSANGDDSDDESDFDNDDDDNGGSDDEDHGGIQDNFEAGVVPTSDDESQGSITTLDPRIGSVLFSKLCSAG